MSTEDHKSFLYGFGLIVVLLFAIFGSELWKTDISVIQVDRRPMTGSWTVLVTGGAGFVGAHTVIPMLDNNYNVIVLDNLVNAYKDPQEKKPEALRRVEQITGREVTFYNVDIKDEEALYEVFQKININEMKHVVEELKGHQFIDMYRLGSLYSHFISFLCRFIFLKTPLPFISNPRLNLSNKLFTNNSYSSAGDRKIRLITQEFGQSKIIPSQEHSVDCVIHFAALKAVAESCEKPLEYYKSNVVGSINLLEAMKVHNVRKLVYSSSATIYGTPRTLPITEDHPTGQNITNPYGRTKYVVEEMMKDLCKSDGSWSIISLRYFNPVGAHSSGQLGEDPKGIPNNLMPYISKVAVGKLDKLKVFGSDYNTHDGTGERDYIHIEDLADGHLKALNKLEKSSGLGFKAYNLGTGNGYTVLEVVETFKKVSGREIKYEIVGRRSGDIDSSYADATLAEKELQWSAKRNLMDMCYDTWRWQSQNPNGFKPS